MLKEKLEQRKCFPTAWGKLIPEEEAYRQLNRQIAAMTANLFQVMRIFEPSWEKAHRGHLRHRQHDEYGGRRYTGGTEGLCQCVAL